MFLLSSSKDTDWNNLDTIQELSDQQAYCISLKRHYCRTVSFILFPLSSQKPLYETISLILFSFSAIKNPIWNYKFHFVLSFINKRHYLKLLVSLCSFYRIQLYHKKRNICHTIQCFDKIKDTIWNQKWWYGDILSHQLDI